MSKIKFFQIIDQAIFNQIDQMKNDPNIAKITDSLNAMDDKSQRLASGAISATVILLPVILVSVYFYLNQSLRSSIQIKEDIIAQVAEIDKHNRQLTQISQSSIGAQAFEDRAQLEQRLRILLSQNQIDASKVNVIDFNQINSTEMTISSESKIEISRFANQDLSKFLRGLLEREKFKIQDINLNKDTESNLLNGSLTLLHIGKNNTAVEQE